ncbi:MAG: DrmB family protein [Dehalococcoidia bacterium]
MSVRAGELRPSQAVTQSGPGALIDLPTLSMVVAGTDEWNLNTARRVDEPRLARLLHVTTFRQPPYLKEGAGGIPARMFPRYLVCPRCNRLALHTSFEFNAGQREHRCKSPQCGGQGKAVAYPARFMVACPSGHLADFPWHAYIHPPEVQCTAELTLEDSGSTGAITDLWVKCKTHGVAKNLGQAFGIAGRNRLPRCSAARPWLGDHDPAGCDLQPHVLLRGASNAYFPVVASAISIPPWSDPIQMALGPYIEQLARVDSLEKLRGWLEFVNAPELEEFPAERLWDAIQRRRSGADRDELSLKAEEWRAFQAPQTRIDAKAEFRSRVVSVPEEGKEFVARVVQLERLREVRVLRAFTRIDPMPDIGDHDDVSAIALALAPICRHKLDWLPGIDYRGEGLLIQLDERRILNWEARPEVVDLEVRQQRAERAWYQARGIELREPRPVRYVLLHTLAHLLIRQLALDCGYSSASLRERIYCSKDSGSSMAGVLIYTASSDSDGSLGGLVEMGRPDTLGPLLARALDNASLCANDPLCADRDPAATGSHLNGAACHACVLLSETACEAGNHYLDRGAVVPTLRNVGTAFISG